MSINCIMFFVYTSLFIGSNKLHGLGTRGFSPSCLGSTLSYLVQTRPSLFTPAVTCSSIFLLYVDDLIITFNDPSHVDIIIRKLDSKFSTKDLGVVSFFFGVEVLATSMGLCNYLSKNMLLIF